MRNGPAMRASPAAARPAETQPVIGPNGSSGRRSADSRTVKAPSPRIDSADPPAQARAAGRCRTARRPVTTATETATQQVTATARGSGPARADVAGEEARTQTL